MEYKIVNITSLEAQFDATPDLVGIFANALMRTIAGIYRIFRLPWPARGRHGRIAVFDYNFCFGRTVPLGIDQIRSVEKLLKLSGCV